MSRTYRRVGKANNPENELSWITCDNYIRTEYKWRLAPREFLQGKEYRKAWWIYHMDHHRNWWGSAKRHRKDWGDVRSTNRNNLVGHLRDDRECFFWEDVNTRDYD